MSPKPLDEQAVVKCLRMMQPRRFRRGLVIMLCALAAAAFWFGLEWLLTKIVGG